MHPGRLELVDREICYGPNDSVLWKLPISAIRVIGEATNDHGPFLDDYFLCFATDANTWYEASFYAEGREHLLKMLGNLFGCELVLKLVASTEYDSNVIWPANLAGMKMFSFRPVHPKTWIGRLIGSSSNTQWFSEAVLAELQREARTGSSA
jgi:hypothetical protein